MLNRLFTYNPIVTPAAETIDKVQMSFLEWLVEEETTKQNNYRTYRKYYDGDHDTQLTTRMRKYLQIKNSQEFNTNYCPIVVDAVAERLIVTGFDAGDQAEMFWEWWNKNRMDGQQRIVHSSGGRDGDAYVIVEWDEQNDYPIITPQMAYDGTEGVKVHYSHEQKGQIECATKRWRVERGEQAGKLRRLNVYWPDRIEKYFSNSDLSEGNWRPYYENDTEDYIQWWTYTGTEGGEPLGVPVYHFKANDRGYNYGKSDLHDILPIQNALNKSVIDLLAGADSTAFQMLAWLGDDPSNVDIAPGMNLYSLKPPGEVDIKVIPPASLAPLLDVVASFEAKIAKISRIPLSHFQVTGQVAAEGTLKQQESGLVAKVQDRQVGYGNSWEDVMAMCRKLNNVFGSGPEMSEDEPISTQWEDAEVRNEKEHIEAIGIKVEKLKIPLLAAWREANYTPDEIKQMLEDLKAQDGFGFADINDEITQ